MKKILIYLVLIVMCHECFSNDMTIQDQRIKIIHYRENTIVPVFGTAFVSTQIILGNNEQIVDIQGGDADAWTVNVDKTFSNTLNIKPTTLGSHTNLTVSTTNNEGIRRNYYFELHSAARSDTTPQQTYAIIFKYPDPIPKTTKNVLTPPQYHWKYRFHGDHTLMPQRVFDDGQFTYFELKKNQPIPAIFAVLNARGDESVVNFRRQGDTLVVLQTAPQFTLRSGGHVSSVFNDEAIVRLRYGY